MNLYEALKAGTSTKELVDNFYKDLSEASKRITEEKKQAEEAAAKKEELKRFRSALINAALDYTRKYTEIILHEKMEDEEIETLAKEFEQILVNSEKEVESLASLSEKDIFKNKNIKIFSNPLDDDIINDFLRSLK